MPQALSSTLQSDYRAGGDPWGKHRDAHSCVLLQSRKQSRTWYSIRDPGTKTELWEMLPELSWCTKAQTLCHFKGGASAFDCDSIKVSPQFPDIWPHNQGGGFGCFFIRHMVYSARLQMASTKIAVLIWVSKNNSWEACSVRGRWLHAAPGRKKHKENIWSELPQSWNWVQISLCSNCYMISHLNGTL